MAHLSKCRYEFCRGDTINADFHPECRAAFNEDLLARLQKMYEAILYQGVPPELAKILSGAKFQTLEEYQKEKEEMKRLEREQADWERRMHAVSQKASDTALEEWKKTNPEPNPRRYA